MIESLKIKNFGIHKEIDWKNLGNINLVIGENATGKTCFLKAVYSALRTLQDTGRGDDNKSINEVLAEKLYWTYQVEKLGDLVRKNAEGLLELELKESNNGLFFYEFGKDTSKKILNVRCNDTEDHTVVFIPAKEVLSIFSIILTSRDRDKVFGFDDTYLDLVRSLQIPSQKGRNYGAFAQSKKELSNLIQGKAEYDVNTNKWLFRSNSKQKYSIGVVSEGIKKISILDTLLSNRTLNNNSILIIDEVEAALHPKAISKFMDILWLLSECGIQIFLATHSYFVIKKLYILSQKNKMHIPILSLMKESENIIYSDMLDGMPDNEIIKESIRLYEEEVEEAFK